MGSLEMMTMTSGRRRVTAFFCSLARKTKRTLLLGHVKFTLMALRTVGFNNFRPREDTTLH